MINTIHQITLINGSDHGRVYESKESLENGHILNIPKVPSIRRCHDDWDIRHATAHFTMRYRVVGGYAYYIGESMVEPWIDLFV